MCISLTVAVLRLPQKAVSNPFPPMVKLVLCIPLCVFQAAASIAAQLRTSQMSDLLGSPSVDLDDSQHDLSATSKDLDVATLQSALDELRKEFKEYQEQKVKNVE